MGRKGSKRTEEADHEKDEVIRLLSPLGDVAAKAMFGGWGIFADKKMFALVNTAGQLCLKADDSNRGQFDEAGRHGKMPYYAVPAEVRSDTRKLRAWAKRSIAVAHG